jgi:hypothetical protein
LSWRLVCDSIHRLCVTGIWLGHRPGSLGRIFTGSYSLPPSLVVIWSFIIPVTKVPCGPRETTISRDQWLVVVTVVVWCPLRILVVLRRAWNRHVSFRQDSGDVGAHLASLILSLCNRLFFGARYESSLWAQKNDHFTWLVASFGNCRCLMPVMNMSYQ